MKKYAILLGFIDKQMLLIDRLFSEIEAVNLDGYESRYLFALKTQQFYTAIEDLLKQVAKAFENHIEDMSSYHKELLVRLNTEIPNIRPALLSKESYLLLDKVRSFRHFIRHAYDCELDQKELELIQDNIRCDFSSARKDIDSFRSFVQELSD